MNASALANLVDQVSSLVNKRTGVLLGESQRAMVGSRLQRRMSELRLGTPEEYSLYLKNHFELEANALVSLLTTHHTYFFRETSHFEYFAESLLPGMIPKIRERSDKTLRVFSAACSKGHEVYSLVAFLKTHLARVAPDIRFEIVGADVDPVSVKFAQNAVYPRKEVEQIPKVYLDGNWDFGTGDIFEFARVKKSVRDVCRFYPANLLDPKPVAGNQKFDVIFCRNVFIYFKPADIEKAVLGLKDQLSDIGCLFVGVSESLNGLNIGMQSVGPSAYAPKKAALAVAPVVVPEKREPIRVLCVDDSPTIHKLLDKILGDDADFKIVGHAINGEEGLRLMNELKPDAITLDLHMPVLDGLGFLNKTQGTSRPPVIIMSTLDRSSGEEGPQALKMGAQDYVAKPDASNMDRVKDELKTKLKLVTKSAKSSPVASTSTKETSAAVTKKTRVLVVDDSSSIRTLLTKVIGSASDLEVVATVDHPHKAKAAIEQFKPDVITLDIHMPDQDGVSLLKELMPRYKIPTIMITSITMQEGPMVLNALEAGAVDYIQKPKFEDLAEVTQTIQESIRAAAKVKVRGSSAVYRRSVKSASKSLSNDYEQIIAIGSSTGGTEALKVVLTRLPADIPPIVIVQHIPPVFSKAFADRLNEICPFEVFEGVDGMELKSGRVIVAPGGKQMRLKKTPTGYCVSIRDEAPVNRHCPSVDVLFDSCADLVKERAIGVILTGMGADGARGLVKMKQAGAPTFAQDEASCVVFGMPKEAIRMGGASKVVPLDRMASEVQKVIKHSIKSPTKKVA